VTATAAAAGGHLAADAQSIMHTTRTTHTLMGDERSSGCVSVAGASSGLCYFISVSLSGYRVERKRCWNRPVAYPICRSVHVCVCLSVCRTVQKVYCHKMTDWIRMLFRLVSGVGRGMAVLDGVVIAEEESIVLEVNLGTSHCNQYFVV